MSLLELERLRVHLPLKRGWFGGAVSTVKAVDDVSLAVAEGETLGLVGESGCGKSTLARSIVGLVESTSGAIRFNGQNITRLSHRERAPLRRQMQMIFQDPYASLNPRRTVYDTLAEPLLVHHIVPRAEVPATVSALMEKVGLARRFVRKYPHEFSGGQRQRIAIARALAVKPRLILADEPVSALDVSIQAQILNLLQDLCREEQLTMILISHDLSVVNHMSRRIAVMYLGKIVELGPAASVFRNPQHPYTRALVSAIPAPHPKWETQRQRIVLRGDPPSPIHPPQGCPFHPRCPWAIEACTEAMPPHFDRGPGHTAACIRLDVVEAEAPRTAA